MRDTPLVSIIMGSDSDLPVVKGGAELLEKLKIPFEITIISAHRTPEALYDYVKKAEERGIEVIIAVAGAAAHLPGVIAALTHLPVIGVPIKSGALLGMDALLSIVQMPSGVPVATVGINNTKNASLLAARILSLKYPEIKQELKAYIDNMKKSVEKKRSTIESIGYKEYLERMGADS